MIKDIEKLKYPTGVFRFRGPLGDEERRICLEKIRTLPVQLAGLIGNLSEKQLESTYREGGWTGRQVIHHVADSHMNALIRFKWTLTEETPEIKAYDEKAWAELADTQKTPVNVSVALLESLHARWIVLLEAMSPADFQRTLFHPEHRRAITLDEMLSLYAWHGEHHLGHLKLLMDDNRSNRIS